MPACLMQALIASGPDIDLDAERDEHVGGARARRQRAVAVLCHRHPGAGDDEGGAGGDVERARGVAAGADHVDGVGGRHDAQHLAAHRRDRPGDLLDGLAAHPQSHQQAADLRWRHLAGHHALERLERRFAAQRRPGRHLPDQRLDLDHGVLSASGAAGGGRWRHSNPRRGRGSSSGSDDRARTRCFRGGTARRARAGSDAGAP